MHASRGSPSRCAVKRSNAATRLRGPTSRACSRRCRRRNKAASRSTSTCQPDGIRLEVSGELESGLVLPLATDARSTCCPTPSIARAPNAESRPACAPSGASRRWPGRGSPVTATSRARATGRASPPRRGGSSVRPLPRVRDCREGLRFRRARSLRGVARLESLERASRGVARRAPRAGGFAADDLDRDAGVPTRSEMARPRGCHGPGAGPSPLGALHRRRCERRSGARAPPRCARRTRLENQGRPPPGERQHQSRDELRGRARRRRFPPIPRPGRRARAGCARRDRARARRGARRRRPLHRRRQDRRRWPPLCASIQARLVAGASALVHVLLARVRRPPVAVRRARRFSGGLRGFAGLRLCAARDRARAEHRPCPARPLSLARDAGLDGHVGRRQARELRRRSQCDRRGARAPRQPRASRAAGLGGERRPGALPACVPRRGPPRRDPDSLPQPPRGARPLPRLARGDHVSQLRSRDRRQRERRSGHA